MNTKLPSPCFILDEKALERNLQVIRRIQTKASIDIILAFKGFALWSVFPLVRKYIQSATASSLHEAMLCKEHMNSKAHSYCVAYRSDEFEEMLELSSHMTFNSLEQLHLFGKRAVDKNVSVGLRVNPQCSDVETALYNPADPFSRLGVSPNELQEGVPSFVEGLHFHTLCESNVDALKEVLLAVEKHFGHLLNSLKWINLGGGHLMTSKSYDEEQLISILGRFKKKYDLDIYMEPGSAFAWQTGSLSTTVLDIVDRMGKKTAILDASFTCHMPDCLEMPYRPDIEEGSANPKQYSHKYRLGGVSCLAGDFLEEYSFERPLAVGDRITFQDMMHYTMVKTNTFNGIQHPAIAIKRATGQIDLVKTFDYTDYRDRLS